jgi:(4S)-4-hydroxy-5-phosphonooxypentane-2,3-dione isomerase
VFVVTVDFEISPECIDAFMSEMHLNAAQSLRDEVGCKQFDVCVDPVRNNAVFLYELYTSREAFDDHLCSAHFLSFNVKVTPWVISKQVRTYHRTHPLSE